MAPHLLLKRLMKNLIIVLLSILSLSVFAQREELDQKWPHLKEGRMFTLKLVPAGKKLEVQVIGKDVATVDLNDIALFATGRSGADTWDVQVSREGDRFMLVNPAGTKNVPSLDLKLKVVRKKQAEEFQFISVPAPR